MEAISSPQVSLTVYSVVWPQTEALMRECLVQEADRMLARHRHAFTKQQDVLHDSFFAAWKRFAAPCVQGLDQFSQAYPCAGSSEAIREVIRQAGARGQALVVFDGDYEGYEALASQQGTQIIRVDRHHWQEQVDQWCKAGVPWSEAGAQWWVSQPSAIDGNVWPDFADWLTAITALPGCQVWVDLCYVGSAIQEHPIHLPNHPSLAGVVFSLSKVMGAYYRRIGGCLSREDIPGLWGNRWFKNLDSLYLGQRWLDHVGSATSTAQYARQYQAAAMARALDSLGGKEVWERAGIIWRASDVPLLMHASPSSTPPAGFDEIWRSSQRGKDNSMGARLCLTPFIESIIEETHHVA